MELIKNIEKNKSFTIADLVDYQESSVTSLSLAQKPGVSISVMALEMGEELSTHAAPGDAFVNILEGEGDFVIDGKLHTLKKGEGLVMPAGEPHSVHARKRFKMLLTIVKE